MRHKRSLIDATTADQHAASVRPSSPVTGIPATINIRSMPRVARGRAERSDVGQCDHVGGLPDIYAARTEVDPRQPPRNGLPGVAAQDAAVFRGTSWRSYPVPPCVGLARSLACASPLRSAAPSKPLFRDASRRLLQTCCRLGHRHGCPGRLTLVLPTGVILGSCHEPETTRSSHSDFCLSLASGMGPP